MTYYEKMTRKSGSYTTLSAVREDIVIAKHIAAVRGIPMHALFHTMCQRELARLGQTDQSILGDLVKTVKLQLLLTRKDYETLQDLADTEQLTTNAAIGLLLERYRCKDDFPITEKEKELIKIIRFGTTETEMAGNAEHSLMASPLPIERISETEEAKKEREIKESIHRMQAKARKKEEEQ